MYWASWIDYIYIYIYIYIWNKWQLTWLETWRFAYFKEFPRAHYFRSNNSQCIGYLTFNWNDACFECPNFTSNYSSGRLVSQFTILKELTKSLTFSAMVQVTVCHWTIRRLNQRMATQLTDAYVRHVDSICLIFYTQRLQLVRFYIQGNIFYRYVIYNPNCIGNLGPISISDKTSYCKITWSIEAARFVFRIVRSLWNLSGTSAAVLPTCLPNPKAMR